MNTLEHLLRKIVASEVLHQRWLETLSHLEHCGARKIHRLQVPGRVPLALLQHAAEEARHALLFKLFSGKLGGAAPQASQLLGLPLGKRYLDVLDLWVSRQLRHHLRVNKEHCPHACYLLTTLVIEKRAEQLYPLYEQILQESGASFSLQEIIREETQHLKLINRQIAAVPGLQAMVGAALDYEETLFQRWLVQLGYCCANSSSLIHPTL